MFWALMKYVILGPILKLVYRPKVKGIENLPAEGAAILAPNHESFLDDFMVPLMIRKRRVVMLAKADYFDKWYTAWFFKAAGCIPVRREGGSASAKAKRRCSRRSQPARRSNSCSCRTRSSLGCSPGGMSPQR